MRSTGLGLLLQTQVYSKEGPKEWAKKNHLEDVYAKVLL